MSGWLPGTRALVVGAGSGIGRAVVDAFVAEGARVVATDIDHAKVDALAADRPGVAAIASDATSIESSRAAVSAAVEHLGGIDTLVNCVGIFDFYRGLRDLPDDEIVDAFDEINRLNVLSQIVPAKAALEPLTQARGSIILTVSTSGFRPGRGGALYVASKFAVRGLVVSLAHDLAPEVRVNGVAPGGTLDTDLRGPETLGLVDQRLDDPDRAANMRGRTPLKVEMRTVDQVGAYVYLASTRARIVTGTFLHPDGGTTLGG